MNYLDIKHCNMVNGEGLRTVIWVAGCERKCPGCFSPRTHSFQSGIPFDEVAKEEFFRDSAADWCAGVTFLGGEPLHPSNYPEVLALAREHKKLFPDKNTWLYTGYTLAEIYDIGEAEILDYVDVLCEGPFVEKLKDPDVEWVGSSNQRVLRLPRDLEV